MKLTEIMVYNNFFLRAILSIFFLLIYIAVCFYNFNYIFYLIILVYLLILTEIILYFKKNQFLIILYLFFSFFFTLTIDFSNSNIFNFSLMIIIIISFDIFSYLIGGKYGKSRLIKISPNKTIEGLIGGILFSFILSLIFSIFYEIQITLSLIFFIILIIIFSFIGDIVESKFKRINNLKNSSNMLPGHGGFFDRFDSFVLSIIPYSILNNFLL
ncbi:MAG: hypothetical protein CBD97_02805 [Pelagibacteraceae bacterium TMED237]|nr:MAG: hypothetical protein CBD97_02805 [Pelagibacteraceae bacterium TMED237]|tara:strand:+ start:6600 stop:7241 length:642 start_codon:yes stop_codon:yes gene_type:complete